MQGPHLVYFADPMCSWCWGFSPVMQSVADRFGAALPIRLVLGGLRPWTRDPMDAADRQEVMQHWQHVREASGQPFDFAFFDRNHFIYDTEPPSRAVIVLRRTHGMQAALSGLRRIQQAFYAENQDVTDIEQLAGIAAELGLPPNTFRDEFASEAAAEETREDFAIAQTSGVRGFPTLIAGDGRRNQYALITRGFQPAAPIISALESWLAQIPEASTERL